MPSSTRSRQSFYYRLHLTWAAWLKVNFFMNMSFRRVGLYYLVTSGCFLVMGPSLEPWSARRSYNTVPMEQLAAWGEKTRHVINTITLPESSVKKMWLLNAISYLRFHHTLLCWFSFFSLHFIRTLKYIAHANVFKNSLLSFVLV